MILLDAADVTTIQKTGPGVSETTTTDTLFISSVTIDLASGSMYATIQRGGGNPFLANMDPLQVIVNPDGTFYSSDGTWSGSVGLNAPLLVAQLRATFDHFILASGKVTGILK